MKLPKQSLKPYVLLCAHLMGEKIPQSLQKDYQYILKEAPAILQGMINWIVSYPPFVRRIPPELKGNAQIKFMGAKVIENLIEFQQYIMQVRTLSEQEGVDVDANK